MLGKVKFTKASEKDKDLVTLTVAQLTPGDTNFKNRFFTHGREFVVSVEGVPVVFTVNRQGRTLSTKGFPRRLRLPKVGKPVQYNVDYWHFFLLGDN